MVSISREVIYEIDSGLDVYQVIEEIYNGRPSRVLYSAKNQTAQSGLALDDGQAMLFEYNQRLVELIEQLKPKRILLIGGGAYTLPSHVAKKYPLTSLDVIEPDKELNIVAVKYFNFQKTNQIQIINTYGLDYLKRNRRNYDLIIIDAYSGYSIPTEILSRKFAKLTAQSLGSRGLLAVNVISDLSQSSPLKQLHSRYKKHYRQFKVFPAEAGQTYFYPRNLIYVAAKQPIEINLRHPELTSSDFAA